MKKLTSILASITIAVGAFAQDGINLMPSLSSTTVGPVS